MIFDTVYLGTCILRLNITKFVQLGCSFMHNDRVRIPALHMAHDAKFFSPCVYSYFHRQLHVSDNLILLQKCQSLGFMSIK